MKKLLLLLFPLITLFSCADDKNCQNLATEIFNEAVNEAKADSTVWQFSGAESIEDYANGRKRVMYKICTSYED